LPRYAADRTLRAPLDDVWEFLAEPYNLADWWPGISGVEPDRRGLAPGARWVVVGPNQPTYLRRPQMNGTLLVLDVVPLERFSFQLVNDRIEAELSLRAHDERSTDAELVVDAGWFTVRRSFPREALGRLHALLWSGEEPWT
jgi:uncharacterized protein YndB with AHSA1/START domain